MPPAARGGQLTEIGLATMSQAVRQTIRAEGRWCGYKMSGFILAQALRRMTIGLVRNSDPEGITHGALGNGDDIFNCLKAIWCFVGGGVALGGGVT